jgi:hypothetical protein
VLDLSGEIAELLYSTPGGAEEADSREARSVLPAANAVRESDPSLVEREARDGGQLAGVRMQPGGSQDEDRSSDTRSGQNPARDNSTRATGQAH